MRRSAALWVIILSALFASGVAAWVQTQRPGSDGGLVPLAWETSCYYYSIHEAGSDDVDMENLRQLVRASFDAWQNTPGTYFEFIETDLAQVDEIGLNTDRGNVNLLIWREQESDWPTSKSVTALTTTSYSQTDGAILDSDIELNGAYTQFGDSDSYPDDTTVMDLRGTITHEIGHSIGLDHSQDPTATMSASSPPGETQKRTLEQDDIDGLCTIYPLANDPDVCKEPLCGLDLKGETTTCKDTTPPPDSCACSLPGQPHPFKRNLLRLLLKKGVWHLF